MTKAILTDEEKKDAQEIVELMLLLNNIGRAELRGYAKCLSAIHFICEPENQSSA